MSPVTGSPITNNGIAVFGNWQFGVNLQNLLNEAKALVQVDGYQGLGRDTTAQTTLVASHVNRAISDILEACPALNLTESTKTLTSGTSGYAIPSGMRNIDIRKIKFSNTGTDAVHDLRELSYVSRGEVSNLIPMMKNGQYPVNWPMLWSFNDDATEILFYPQPNDSTISVVISYRAKPTDITAANVASPSAVSIAEVPTRYQSVLATWLAREWARLLPNKIDLYMRLDKEYSNPRPRPEKGERLGMLEKAQDELSTTLAQWKANPATDRLATGLIDKQNLCSQFGSRFI